MSYSELISPRKMDCMTLNIMAIISLKTSRSAEPVTQCNIPEELNTYVHCFYRNFLDVTSYDKST